MEFKLKPLRTSSLSNLEAGQLINRHRTDLGTIDAALLTDTPYNNYLQTLEDQSFLYTKALQQLQMNEETRMVANADRKRDRSVSAFGTSVRLYSFSDDDEELEASRGLTIILRNFKDIPGMNYEAETQAIDKLLIELAAPAALEKINRLSIERYVTRMQADNDTFKMLFSSRIQTEAFTEAYDMKVIRKEIYRTYSDFIKYVLSMAKATEGELYTTALSLINTARGYYADILARRKKKKEAEEA